MKKLILISIIFLLHIILSGQEKKHFTLDDIFNSHFYHHSSGLGNIHWLSDGKTFIYQTYDDNGNKNFIHYDCYSGESQTLVHGENITDPESGSPVPLINIIWAPDSKSFLITGLKMARDIKSAGDIYHYELASKKIKTISSGQKNQLNIKYAPDAQKIGFVRDNNIYIHNLVNDKQQQLTFDGSNTILNGHFDWVYEEEFGIIEGWQWSPDSRYIAFWQTDQSNVPLYPITFYDDSLYLHQEIMRYPKAGDTNSRVRIGIIEIETGKIIWDDFDKDDDYYIPRIYWSPASENLAIFKFNRTQNQIRIYFMNPVSGSTKLIFKEKDEKWLEIEETDFVFCDDSKSFFWLSERSGFMHIYRYELKSGQLNQITTGDWEVRKIIATDQTDKKIYFTATRKSPIENQLYSIDFDGQNLARMTFKPGYHNPEFSPGCNYFIDKFSSAGSLSQILLYRRDGLLMKDFSATRKDLSQEYEIAKPEFITITTSDGINLNAWLLKPVDFDPDVKYPVFVQAYGGPGSQRVLNYSRIATRWHQMLVQNGYLVFGVDGRGTAGRGAEFKKVVYKNLGSLDVRDQIESARHLATLPYVDSSRIGIYGWSYGGYMAAMCLLKGNDVFKAAIAVAPVSDWRFYDTIYTERYMQTPQLNPEGYKNSSVLNYAGNLKGKLLLIHGMADDNVHFQNSAELANALIAHNKQFQIMFYPDRRHSIYQKSRYTRKHVFTVITNFIFENI